MKKISFMKEPSYYPTATADVVFKVQRMSSVVESDGHFQMGIQEGIE